MKKIILLLSINMISSVAWSGSNEKISNAMSAVLQSNEVQSYINESTLHFYGIQYVKSGRAIFGPDTFKLLLNSSTDSCEIYVDSDSRDNTIMNINKNNCL